MQSDFVQFPLSEWPQTGEVKQKYCSAHYGILVNRFETKIEIDLTWEIFLHLTNRKKILSRMMTEYARWTSAIIS